MICINGNIAMVTLLGRHAINPLKLSYPVNGIVSGPADWKPLLPVRGEDVLRHEFVLDENRWMRKRIRIQLVRDLMVRAVASSTLLAALPCAWLPFLLEMMID